MKSGGDKWALVTVPHSGTRYVKGTLERAYGEQEVAGFGDNDKPWQWGHWYHYVKSPAAKDPNRKVMAVVRNPVHTWATHFYNSDVLVANENLAAAVDRVETKKKQLLSNYTLQEEWADKIDLWWKCEEDAALLGKNFGVETRTGARTYHEGTPMKTAVAFRDVKKIRELSYFTDFWDWFVEDLSPLIRERYEGFGYEFWWMNDG